jgi:hypothetical protein
VKVEGDELWIVRRLGHIGGIGLKSEARMAVLRAPPIVMSAPAIAFGGRKEGRLVQVDGAVKLDSPL